MVNKKSFPRSYRLNKLLYKEISKIFLYEISDPSFADLTVTAVKLSDDLKVAKIYYVTHNQDLKDKVKRKIPKTKPLIRAIVAKNIILKKVPDFEFEYDTVFEEGFRIDKLLDEVKKKKGV